MGGGSKQLRRLAGRPVLAHTVAVFDPLPAVAEIVVAVDPADMDRCQHEVLIPGNFQKVKALVPGGPHRAASVQHALAALTDAVDTVAVHDGARPLFEGSLLEPALALLDAGEADGVVFGIPVTDTIKEVDADGVVTATPARDRLRAAQTPQVFRRALLEQVYRAAPGALAAATDDAALVEAAGGRVRVVPGSPENIKLTTPVDMDLAAAIIARRRRASGDRRPGKEAS